MEDSVDDDRHALEQVDVGGPKAELRIERLGRRIVAKKLNPGEEAVALAIELHADLLLMDDRDGVRAARRKGIEVTGTLGLLGIAAKSGLLNLADACDRIGRMPDHGILHQ